MVIRTRGLGSNLPRRRRLLLISELRLLFPMETFHDDLRELRSCCVDVDLADVVDEWLGKLVEAAHDLRAQVFNLYFVLIMWKLWWIWLVW